MDNKSTRVLIVEGDADEASIIGTYLAESTDHAEKFELSQAPRLSTALHLLAKRAFDVVLIDLVLPHSVGLEGFHQIRKIKPETPVIVLTGLQDVPLAVQAVKLGAHDYFIKGSPDCCLIKRAIRYALERKRLTDAIEGLIGADDAPKLVVGADGVVQYANAAAQEAFARAPQDLMNKPFGYGLPEADGETTIPSPQASGKLLELRVRSISWNGSPARLVTLRDASLSHQLKRLQAEIQEGLRVVEVKNHFMSHISHELRNTLSTLTTSAFCLKEGVGGALTPRQARLVDIIVRNLDRQEKIIDNVLDLARFQSGKLKIEFRPLDMNAVIAQIGEEYGLTGAGLKLRIDVIGSLPSIEGDPDLIAQVLHNLLDNALRFAKKNVVVTASKEKEGNVVVSVVDDGPGIPPERLEELFVEFVQLNRSGHQNVPDPNGYKGTGLGLAICKEIVEGHQGKIWADNTPGQGARFSFSLPAKRKEPSLFADDGAPVPAGAPPRGRTSRDDVPSYSGHR